MEKMEPPEEKPFSIFQPKESQPPPIISSKVPSVAKSCLFSNDLNYTTEIYNIPKYPLPRNCEVILNFKKLNMVRVGITFDKDIIKNKDNEYSPLYDIYYILEDLKQFYTLADD